MPQVMHLVEKTQNKAISQPYLDMNNWEKNAEITLRIWFNKLVSKDHQFHLYENIENTR